MGVVGRGTVERGYSARDRHDLQGLGPTSWEPKLSDCHPACRVQDQELVGRRNELSDSLSAPEVPSVKDPLRQR